MADIATLQNDLNQLKSDFIIAVSVLGGVSIFLFCSIIGLYISNHYINKRLNNDPFYNFKLARPKLNKKPSNDTTIPTTRAFDNLVFSDSSEHHRNNHDNGGSNMLNPISRRTQTEIDNSNFSFSNPDYLARDSRFY